MMYPSSIYLFMWQISHASEVLHHKCYTSGNSLNWFCPHFVKWWCHLGNNLNTHYFMHCRSVVAENPEVLVRLLVWPQCSFIYTKKTCTVAQDGCERASRSDVALVSWFHYSHPEQSSKPPFIRLSYHLAWAFEKAKLSLLSLFRQSHPLLLAKIRLL